MKHKLFQNPILKKEMMIGSRSIKMSMMIMGINLFLIMIVMMIMSISNTISSDGFYDYASLSSIFVVISCIECGMISLVVPIITSGSIAGERERQTLDIMLTTPISPFAIAVGKLQSALVMVMLYMFTSIPVLSIAFVLGGMNWSAIIGLFGMHLYLGIYVGSVGVFSSSIVKKSVLATILTIAIGIGIITVTTILFYVVLIMGLSVAFTVQTNPTLQYIAPLIMFLNPYSPFVDFLIRTMSDSSLYDAVADGGTLPFGLALVYKMWIPISIIINLLVSYGFLKAAAFNIATTRNVKTKKNSKNM